MLFTAVKYSEKKKKIETKRKSECSGRVVLESKKMRKLRTAYEFHRKGKGVTINLHEYMIRLQFEIK